MHNWIILSNSFTASYESYCLNYKSIIANLIKNLNTMRLHCKTSSHFPCSCDVILHFQVVIYIQLSSDLVCACINLGWTASHNRKHDKYVYEICTSYHQHPQRPIRIDACLLWLPYIETLNKQYYFVSLAPGELHQTIIKCTSFPICFRVPLLYTSTRNAAYGNI